MGKAVTANDFLNFPATIARATVENSQAQLTDDDVTRILSPAPDARDFIQRTFRGLYFPPDDLAFLDSAWAHIDRLPPYKCDLALSALCLGAARKQPRGVFTVTDLRYDDGRRFLRMPLSDLFREAVAQYNDVVFDNGQRNRALCQDVFDLDAEEFDLVYLDPPYAPPRDDNDYIKRYHFLEGLSIYWEGQRIMEQTTTKKIEKKYTPFAFKRTISSALREAFHRFRHSIIVLSYSSNSVPGGRRSTTSCAVKSSTSTSSACHIDTPLAPMRRPSDVRSTSTSLWDGKRWQTSSPSRSSAALSPTWVATASCPRRCGHGSLMRLPPWRRSRESTERPLPISSASTPTGFRSLGHASDSVMRP